MVSARPLKMLLAVAVVAAGLAAPAGAAPDAVPDRLPVASEPLERAQLVRKGARNRTPSVKRLDGSVGDWIGEPSHIGGAARLDAGEHIYTDYLFDDFGADDGDDAQRLAVLGPLAEAESRTTRIDQLFQAAGDQFDAPRPIGAPDHYGDGERTDTADIREVRWAADGDSVDLLVRTTTLTDRSLAVLVLTGSDPGEPRSIGFGSGLTTRRFDTAHLLTSDGATVTDRDGNTRPSAAGVRIKPDGWTNALEASFPASAMPKSFDVGVVAGRMVDGAFVPANVAYRTAEPLAGMYNDQRQALTLHAGTVDEFGTTIHTAALRRGKSHTVRPGPGYAERQFRSGANISRESGEHGIWQHYGLFVPTSYNPAKDSPLTFWLHYRGGKAHSGGAWTPRLITQLGEETGNIVVTPRARGTSTWYVTEAHQDFFEVYADVHGLLSIDEDRRYLSGYSMGGYGTYLFGLLYPDLFAGGYSTSGAVTQGAWTGEGPDDCRMPCYIEANDGDSDAQNTYRLLENARHLPLTIHHGTNDELVPITGVQRMGVRLAELGYRYDLTMFTGYEHYTQAIIDEWADGAAYLNRFTRVRNPRTVTYKVVPALVEAVNTVSADGVPFTFNPDGAYWTNGLVVRDGDRSDPSASGQLDATSHAIAEAEHLAIPRTGVVSPLGHSTPFVRHGLEWLETGADAQVANAFDANLRNLARAKLNVERMSLKTGKTITGTVTSDGPATLTLTNIGRRVAVTLDGQHLVTTDQDVHLPLTDGAHTVTLRPAR